MNLTIDFLKLSPKTRDLLINEMASLLMKDAREIRSDLQHWPDSQSTTYKEMEGWAKASADLAHELSILRREIKSKE